MLNRRIVPLDQVPAGKMDGEECRPCLYPVNEDTEGAIEWHHGPAEAAVEYSSDDGSIKIYRGRCAHHAEIFPNR